MVVLKNLSREFNINPYKLRMMLRKEFGCHRRWSWEKEDQELKSVRDYLESYMRSISPSHKPSSPDSTPSARVSTIPRR